MTTPTFDREAVAIGRAVRGAIATSGMTQAEVAEASRIALNSFSRRVNGSIPFTWPELVRVAAVTGTTVADLAAAAVRIASAA